MTTYKTVFKVLYEPTTDILEEIKYLLVELNNNCI